MENKSRDPSECLVEELIHELESLYIPGFVPGTIISRCLLPEGSKAQATIGWQVGAGYMGRRLKYFQADTVERALMMAIERFPELER